MGRVQLQDELVVDPNEVFPDLGMNLPVQLLREGWDANQRQRSETPDPARDAGGEENAKVGRGVGHHSDVEEEKDGHRSCLTRL